jgi:uncharacterized protein (DUF1501 family)
MPEINRRNFLRAGIGIGAVGLLAGASAVTLDDLLTAAHDRPLPIGARTLVLVTLYGGNDGINTLIPYADNAYHDARPDLAYAPGEVLHLDSQLGLNPAMTGLAALWRDQRLAIVRGVSYPQPDHSHFRSMDIWQTASPTGPSPSGWIGRWLDATGKDPVRAVNIGSVLPPLAVGQNCTAATLSTSGSPYLPQSLIAAMGTADPADAPTMAQVRDSFRDSLQAAIHVPHRDESGRHRRRARTACPPIDSAEERPGSAARCGGRLHQSARADPGLFSTAGRIRHSFG